MGFLSGRVTFTRFRVSGRAPASFGPAELERLHIQSFGAQRIISADGVEIGWTAGDHILDVDFDLAKNLVNDALRFQLRVDVHKEPAELYRAYYAIELKARSKNNPSGNPSALQKREARDAARGRLELEARDGRFVRRKAIDLLWDRPSNELFVATTANTDIDRLAVHFSASFERKLELISAGRQAFLLAEGREQSRGVDDAGPSPFVPGLSTKDVSWIMDEASRDFIGNEFLLWLWFLTLEETDTLKLSDDSEVAIMLARTLTLECPRGQTGRESITSEGPARLPEAKRAIQVGKLPRKAGLTLVRHDRQYELALHAESLAVSGLKLPAPEDEGDQARREERITRIRDLVETLDLLYDAFGRRRFGPNWNKELGRMQKWLHEVK